MRKPNISRRDIPTPHADACWRAYNAPIAQAEQAAIAAGPHTECSLTIKSVGLELGGLCRGWC